MASAIDPQIHARLRQSLLLGLTRQPLTVPATLTGLLPRDREPALPLLALAAQWQRFAGAPSPVADPVPDAALRLHQDARPILPAPARRALKALARSAEKSLTSNVLPLALRRIQAAGCRLHPFDLPDLVPHIKANAEDQGLAERAFLALTASDSDEDAAKGLFFERITIDNWTTFPKAQRRAFVAGLRRDDPAAGRALIESVWKSEPAPVRAALLDALVVGLGADDQPFLESLSGDRADSVKQVAVQLLARIAERAARGNRLTEAARCFKRAGSLLAKIGLGSASTLTFTLPSDGLKWQETEALRERLFGGLQLSALAAAVGAPPEALIAALPPSEHRILVLLMEAASAEGDDDTVMHIIGARLAAGDSLHGYIVMSLAAKARQPLAPATAQRVLASPAWQKAVKELADATTPAAQKDDGRLVLMAALMPSAAMPAFLASLDALPLATTRGAKDFTDLVLALPR
ncbi:hypothetical protein SSBR45G_68770 [Bradyrhizobium sp. SSBR45G]|uniref:DUF5691 domain-containing protein n=1 Tax=unclassified Bradyrhizobium TaxID=2631580 RepID=UPI002342B5F3|nr:MULTISPECIES: DUF5691 domain-containing protein [unclassified Bradyrhizobium]GLH81968.1 hypothetical protein SSBR45G_68770 [Bradyrhizobium sp. SSBR45G]GLH89429.1 hypothetical protein SSBR45R_68900 [Bradyrhizobium sp. SSBR45R]